MDSSPAKESLPLASIKQDLILAYTECSSRGLIHSANWCVSVRPCVCVSVSVCTRVANNRVYRLLCLLYGWQFWYTKSGSQ